MRKKNLLLQGLSIFLVVAILTGTAITFNYNQDNSTQKPKSVLFLEKFGELKERNSENPSFIDGIKNIRINQFDGVSEPLVAINPIDPSKIIVAANDFRISGNQARVIFSHDNGNNWVSSTVPLSGLAGYTEATDPAVTFDANGNILYAMIHYQTFGNGDGLFVNKSADNGATWKTRATEVKKNSDGLVFEDRPAISTDNSNSAYRNNVYVTWTSLSDESSRILFSRSINGGESFESFIELANGKVHTTDVKVDDNGNIYVAYLVNNNLIQIRKSIDGGNTFSAPIQAVSFEHSGSAYNNTYLLKQNGNTGVKVRSFPSIAILNNNVYIGYSAKNGSDLSDIFVTKSVDGGLTFSTPLRVNNDNTLTDQFMPRLTAQDGKLFMTWLDSRDDVNNQTISTYLGVSPDGGISFDNCKISTQSFNPASILLKNYIGDYIGLAVSSENIVSVWTDGRNNLFDVYAGILPMNPTSVKDEVILTDFVVSQNFPNPFNPSTTISYSIPKENTVTIKLFDVQGKEIATIFSGFVNAGSHRFNFEVKQTKLNLSSGTYIVKVRYGELMKSVKLSYIK